MVLPLQYVCHMWGILQSLSSERCVCARAHVYVCVCARAHVCVCVSERERVGGRGIACLCVGLAEVSMPMPKSVVSYF